MSEVPAGWIVGALGEFVAPQRIPVDPTSVPHLPYVGLEHVQAGTTVILPPATASTVRSTSVRFISGSTLYARLRPYLNKVCAPDFDGVGSAEFIVFPPTRHLASGFLKYLLNQRLFVEFTGTLDSGDRPRVSWEDIRHFRCALPPLAEQERIVAAIEEGLSRIDAGVAALESARRRLRRMRAAAVEQTARTERLQSWSELPITDTMAIVDYRGRTPPFVEHGIPHLRSSNVKGGRIRWDGCAHVSEATYQRFMTRGLPSPGDVLFTTEAPMGQVALAPADRHFCIAQRMMLLKPDPEVWRSEYLICHLESPWFQSKLNLHATGTTVRGISSRNFRPLTVVVPSLDEQDALLASISEQLAAVERLETTVQNQLAHSSILRWSILASAFSGKLTAQDPSEEHASVLFDSDAGQRAATNGGARVPVRGSGARHQKVGA